MKFSSLHHSNILIVSAEIQHALEAQKQLVQFLERWDPKCSLVYSFEQAQQFCEDEHPDLILILENDDDEKILQFAKWVRTHESKRHTGLIVYYLDEILTDEFVIQCLESGIDDCLPSYMKMDVKLARFNTIIQLKKTTDALRFANHKLKVVTLTDDLTGLYNMRGFLKKSKVFMETSKNSLFVLMLDLDHFKQVNDTMNHLVGSHVIAQIGKVIGEHFKNEEALCARYGGDEFIVMGRFKKLDEVTKHIESLRLKISQTQFRYEKKTFAVTSSIGVCAIKKVNPATTLEMLIKAADIQLYYSKDNGRNQIAVDTK